MPEGLFLLRVVRQKIEFRAYVVKNWLDDEHSSKVYPLCPLSKTGCKPVSMSDNVFIHVAVTSPAPKGRYRSLKKMLSLWYQSCLSMTATFSFPNVTFASFLHVRKTVLSALDSGTSSVRLMNSGSEVFSKVRCLLLFYLAVSVI